MSFRELLDTPFALIQANIVALAAVGAATLVLVELAVLGVVAGVSGLTDGSDVSTAWSAVLATAAGVWVLRFVLRGFTVALGTATVAGERIGWRQGFVRFGAEFVPLLVFSLLYTLVGVAVIAVSALLLITLPFGMLWLGYLRAGRFVAVPVLFAERAGHAAAVARSKLLVGGTEWPTTGLWIAQRLLLVLLAVPLLGIPNYLADFSGTHRWAVIALLTSAVLLIAAFGEVVEASTRVVCYIDKRCRREGLDIRVPRAQVVG
ncbi:MULTISPECIES: hypothetical protein [unclassified Nocardia]|uniref:hypothetical protein n=1 Tax=unclassified Nocardia TaxID=2637762 RepID=UPI001CE3FA60|nr:MULTISPECIES: hypothetical protein [unclassified Nocardia]